MRATVRGGVRLAFPFFLFVLPFLAMGEERHAEILQYQTPSLFLALVSNEDSVVFFPSSEARYKYSINDNGVGVSVGLADRIEDWDSSSDDVDFQCFLYFKSIGFDFYYQKYTGYSCSLDSSDRKTECPDLVMSTVTYNIYYRILGRGSIASLANHSDRDVSSSSLVYLVAGCSNQRVLSPMNLIPGDEENTFPDLADIRNINAYSLTVSAGGYWPVWWKHFYIKPGMSLGIGNSFLSARIDTGVDYTYACNLKLLTGFSSQYVDCGLGLISNSNFIVFRNEQEMNFNSISANVYLTIKY